MKKLVLGILAAGTALAAAAPANAAVVIGYSINGGATTTAVTGTSRASTATPVTGFTTFDISGTAYPSAPGLHDLLSQSLNIQSADSTVRTLTVFVTATDLPTLTNGLLSTFTSNRLANSSATISSYYSGTNALFGGTLLQSANFSSRGTFEGSNIFAQTGPFSVTTRYDITFTGTSGTFNGTADITAVPEPATWGMMMLGFGAMGFALRRRRNVETRIRFA